MSRGAKSTFLFLAAEQALHFSIGWRGKLLHCLHVSIGWRSKHMENEDRPPWGRPNNSWITAVLYCGVLYYISIMTRQDIQYTIYRYSQSKGCGQMTLRASYIRKGKYCSAPAATTTTPPPSRSGDPPLDSETGWTGELWSNHVFLILEN